MQLAEAESATVPAGGEIDYTALAAGCMAVTVWLTGGTGAGVHLTMNDFGSENTAAQWAAFKSIIGATKVTKAEVVSDAFNAWFFHYSMDEDFMSTFSTRAPIAETATFKPAATEYASGDASAISWAQAALDCKNVTMRWSKAAGPYKF